MKLSSKNIQLLLSLIILLGVVLFASSSCSNTKYIPSNKSILVKNKIQIKHIDAKKDRRPIADETAVIPIQKPNKNIFGVFRLKLWMYNSVDITKANPKYKAKIKAKALQNKQAYDSFALRKFNYWVKYTLGEAPVYFDSNTIVESKKLLLNYFNNKGYYYKSIETSFATKNKRTTVTYSIKLEEPFKIYDVVFPTGNKLTDQIIRDGKNATLLKFGNYIDVSTLKAERDRIANDLRNRGYYTVTRDNITFDLDTTFDYKKVNIRIVVNRPDSNDFKLYTLNNIYVYPNYTLSNINKLGYYDTIRFKGIDFISDIHKFKPKRLSEFIFLHEGHKYNQELYQLTLQRLSNVGVFKFASIEYKLTPNEPDSNKLDASIFLTPGKRQSFAFDLNQDYKTNGTSDKTVAGFMGSGVSFSYRNKNINKNAGLFTFTIFASLQYTLSKKDSTISKANNFGIIDIGAELAYSENRFIIPFRLKKQSLRSNPKTRFSVSYNYQKRFNYFTLHRFNLKYGYDWFSTPRLHQYLNIADVSVLNIPPGSISDAFRLSLENNPIQKLNFSDGIIPASNYTLQYLGQKTSSDYKFINYMFNVELAGNIVHGIAWLANRKNNPNEVYSIFKTKYFQYVKFESDLRFYFINEDKSALVGRFFAGVGIPYGNRDVMPYIKQFSIGGPNSIRAFRPFTVGPGATPVNRNVNVLQLGDIKLEANIEYRFGLYKWFKGALFADAGNIWNMRRLASLPQGHFQFNRFYKEIALGTGVGVRADFQFFVIRFDVGFSLYDPVYEEGERWQLSSYRIGNKKRGIKTNIPYNINLAIGYPF